MAQFRGPARGGWRAGGFPTFYQSRKFFQALLLAKPLISFGVFVNIFIVVKSSGMGQGRGKHSSKAYKAPDEAISRVVEIDFAATGTFINTNMMKIQFYNDSLVFQFSCVNFLLSFLL